MPLTIEIHQPKQGLWEVELNGRLDTETAPALDARLQEVLSKQVRALRFEMSNLQYVSSMGIRSLFKAFKALKAAKAMFLMVGVQPQIRKVLEIAQALPMETVFASVEEADDYFDAMQRKVLEGDQEPA